MMVDADLNTVRNIAISIGALCLLIAASIFFVVGVGPIGSDSKATVLILEVLAGVSLIGLSLWRSLPEQIVRKITASILCVVAILQLYWFIQFISSSPESYTDQWLQLAMYLLGFLVLIFAAFFCGRSK